MRGGTGQLSVDLYASFLNVDKVAHYVESVEFAVFKKCAFGPRREDVRYVRLDPALPPTSLLVIGRSAGVTEPGHCVRLNPGSHDGYAEMAGFPSVKLGPRHFLRIYLRVVDEPEPVEYDLDVDGWPELPDRWNRMTEVARTVRPYKKPRLRDRVRWLIEDQRERGWSSPMAKKGKGSRGGGKRGC